MIHLKPVLETASLKCPSCNSELSARGWVITGMRNLAELECPKCGREYFGDLASGQALYTPVLLDKKTCTATHNGQAEWFSDWLTNAYANRNSEPIGFEVRQFSPLKNKVILLNCLDTLYGHCLLKLLNAQYYLDQKPDTSLIVIVPPFLEWMLPEGVGEAWIVDLSLHRGTEWNDWLAKEISRRLEPVPEVFLSVAFSHPNAESFDIGRFTRVEPKALENSDGQSPVVTFIWRDDRLWGRSDSADGTHFAKLKKHLGIPEKALDQTEKIIRFAECLRSDHPGLDFAIAGIGEANGFPKWISDLRLTELNAATERAWCERYAKSHIVVGVHGSNMLLPSAHAGGVIELIGADRWGNYLQDILFRGDDPREMFFRYRFVPFSIKPEELAAVASTMLRYADFRRLMSAEYCEHKDEYDFEDLRSSGK